MASPTTGRPLWPVLCLIIGLAALLMLVADRFLLPALQVAQDVDPPARRQLSAISMLMLAIVLFCMFVMLVLVLRPGRFFLPGKSPPRGRTRYVDAWTESARRLKTPPPEEDQ